MKNALLFNKQFHFACFINCGCLIELTAKIEITGISK